MGNVIASITKSLKLRGFDVPYIASRRAKYPLERADLEREFRTRMFDFSRTDGSYEERQARCQALANVLAQFLAVE